MSTFVIGDIQGCDRELGALLDACEFRQDRDRLVLLGDLINRGPDSLAVLRRVRALGDSCLTLLGNHDLAVLAKYFAGKTKGLAGELARAEDGAELAHWLRRQHLALWLDGCLMVHAGLPPEWDRTLTLQLAWEVETVLQGSDFKNFFSNMFGDEPERWSPDLQGMDRWRFITNALTRLRYCRADGSMALSFKLNPSQVPDELTPWFQMPRASENTDILFGHWSTLDQVHFAENRVWGLDTGCVWGGSLSALNLETRQLISLACPGYRKPGQVNGS